MMMQSRSWHLSVICLITGMLFWCYGQRKGRVSLSRLSSSAYGQPFSTTRTGQAMPVNWDLVYVLSWPNADAKITGCFKTTDSAAIHLQIVTAEKTLWWVVSRDVLREGLVYENGLGSFSAGPEDAENVNLTFHPGAKDARTVPVQRLKLAWLIKQSDALVPEGTENYDQAVEAFIASAQEAAK